DRAAVAIEDIKALLKKGKKSRIPKGMKPMLATLVDEPFDDPDWLYEVKWDGYRALCYIQNGQVDIMSRNNKSFNEKYYPMTKLLSTFSFNAVLDAELVVLNEKGISDFSAMQNWRSEVDGDLALVVFDLLWYEGKSLMDLPFVERHAILKEVLPTDDDRIRLSEVFATSGIDFLEAATKIGLEGIMAKKASSPYQSNNRTRDWLKIKVQKRQEVVIGGYTRNEGSPKPFSSLLLGVYEQDGLHYAGKVGTGLTDSQQKELLKRFKPLVSKDSPFTEPPDYNKPSRFRPDPPHAEATWLRPELVCEIHFAEVTEDGVFRHPAFVALREDKDARQVVR